eukprot:TCALIF_01539-PA protein Name:"Protein of unknown function" AED:0.69 eAED:0.70 QI:20/0/0.25/0.5/0.66/0.5/4/13/156
MYDVYTVFRLRTQQMLCGRDTRSLEEFKQKVIQRFPASINRLAILLHAFTIPKPPTLSAKGPNSPPCRTPTTIRDQDGREDQEKAEKTCRLWMESKWPELVWYAFSLERRENVQLHSGGSEIRSLEGKFKTTKDINLIPTDRASDASSPPSFPWVE